MSAGFEQLARLHGIALEYHDIWGKLHHASDATIRALLSAMGIEASDEAAARAAADAETAGRWCSVLPAAIVLRVDERPWRLRLHLPGTLDGTELRWRVEAEDEARFEGPFSPTMLPSLEAETFDGVAYVARELTLDVELPPGYHRMTLCHGGEELGAALLAIVPRRCYVPVALEGDGRVWGASVQLYAVRSERNWGIGDYTDLATIVDQWGRQGAGVVGVNPLHALFPHNPRHTSPYSPSSRLFKNWLYIDVEAVPDFAECDEARAHVRAAEFQARLKTLREADLVDYEGVAAAKRLVLEMLYGQFRARHLARETPRAQSFRAFQSAGGEALRRQALFETLQESFHHEDPSVWGWPVWPESYRDPDSPAVARFGAERLDRVEFFEYLQWQADLQLGTVGRRSFELGLGVGVYEDLAVSVDRGGAEAWANQQLYAVRASVGAPPDDFNLKGQDWGLPPLVPDRLQETAYAPFIATLRANMRHSGALRIDHVMGLMRLFWVPPGGSPADGAYVHYPFADLLGLLVLESHRHRCVVIGEDLGTVPDEVRRALEEAGVLSYRLLYFERQAAGDFKPPADYPAQAIVAASTHDLPTLAGWWSGHDLQVRAELGLFPTDAEREAQIVGRAQDRARLLLALEREGMLPQGATPNPVSVPQMTPVLSRAIHAYLAASPSQLLMVQLEDITGAIDQVNLPGTTDQHPNWCRKLALPLERFADDERFGDLARDLASVRGRRSAAKAPREDASTARIPRATYRLQLHSDFTFADATALVPYLAELGVSHVYCSPYLRARPGSRHGYDIIDHGALNPEIGNRNDFDAFVAALRAHGMGQILDMVPNHMGVMGADNAWWMDVLENGQASVYAEWFDIDWRAIDPAFAGKVLLPVLGEHYGHVLERGELALTYEPHAGAFAVRYFEHRFPVDPREYPQILDRAVRLLGPGEVDATTLSELQSLVAAFGHLPARDDAKAEAVAERNRDKEVHKARLARIAIDHPAIGEAIDRTVRAFNGSTGDRRSFEGLHELLEAQAYRLAYWRVAADEINYRRFFDINDLAALRMENESVFETTHRFVLELAAEGSVDGLRIDHPDGLYDPARYFQRLQERYAQLAGVEPPARPDGQPARPLYVVIEKIIAPHEYLPATWAVHGSTGYRFANVVNGLFVDTSNRSRIDRAWRAFVKHEAVSFDDAAYRGKRTIMRSALAGELTVLARRLLRLARADRRTRDFTINTLQQALAEVVACFPVYRTYVADRLSAQDRRFIDWAVGRARRRSQAADTTVFDFVKHVLLVQPPSDADRAARDEYRAFAMRFQQFTSPVSAKGVEDTAFYTFNRLVSLNDVGGDPDQFGMTVSAFHGASADRAAKWPATMLASSTHDNKRSEDVRTRIDVISEMPAAWRLLLRRWSRLNRSHVGNVDGEPAPARNDEYLLYQTLIGTLPAAPFDDALLEAYRERVAAYMIKAMREAKVRTSWITVNEAYESAVVEFVRRLLARTESSLFLDDLAAQVRAFSWFGALNSLSLTLVKLTSPGVPDIYQGNELLDFSLVDPDNRRPVDYARRRALLDGLKGLASSSAETLPGRVRELLATIDDGRAKLWVTWRALTMRRDHPAAFAHGEYVPLAVAGPRARHVVAYARRSGDQGFVVIAGRLFATLGVDPGAAPLGADIWGDTEVVLDVLPGALTLVDALSGAKHAVADGRMPVAAALSHLPVALLRFPGDND